MIQQLNGHLNVCLLARDDDQPFTFVASRGTRSRRCTGLHDFDVTSAHMPNFIDLATSFANDTPDKIVGNIYLLGLKLLGRMVTRRRGGRRVRVWIPSWHIGRAATASPLRSAAISRRSIGGIRRGRHALLSFDKDVTNVVGSNVNGICNPCYTENSLDIGLI